MQQDRRKLELEYGTSRAMREIFPFYVGQPFERLLMVSVSMLSVLMGHFERIGVAN